MTAFYTLVMTLGYTYGVCTGGVSDNILNNFGVDDMLMNTGRVGLAVTILVSFPLLTVPLVGTLVRAHREMSSKCTTCCRDTCGCQSGGGGKGGESGPSGFVHTPGEGFYYSSSRCRGVVDAEETIGLMRDTSNVT